MRMKTDSDKKSTALHVEHLIHGYLVEVRYIISMVIRCSRRLYCLYPRFKPRVHRLRTLLSCRWTPLHQWLQPTVARHLALQCQAL